MSTDRRGFLRVAGATLAGGAVAGVAGAAPAAASNGDGLSLQLGVVNTPSGDNATGGKTTEIQAPSGDRLSTARRPGPRWRRRPSR